MPDYSAIIKQLTQKQKLRLVADINALNEPEYRHMGIPPLAIDDRYGYHDDDGEGMPDGRLEQAFSPAALAETWDIRLIRQITQTEMREKRRQGKTPIPIPAPKSRIGLYSEGISEEPLISMEVARAYRQACEENSLPFVTRGLCPDAWDAAWMGENPDPDTMEEALLRPMRELKEGDNYALGRILRTDPRFPAYEKAARSVVSALPEGQAVFYRCRRPEDTVRFLQEGYVLIGGNELTLGAALQRDMALRNDMERGRDVHERLEQLTADHEAISAEVVEAALERVLDIAFRAKHLYETDRGNPSPDGNVETNAAEQARRASVATTVLLRNQGLLPLEPPLKLDDFSRKMQVSKPRRIVQIGDPFPVGRDGRTGAERLAVGMMAHGVTIDAYAPGYDPVRPDGGEEHFEKAVALAESADVILLCLGGCRRRTGRALPPNQLLLAEKLCPHGARVVAIVVGDEPFDTGFASNFAGLCRVSSRADEAVTALADVLCGSEDPGGRLAVTLYADTDSRMAARRLSISRYKLKTGPFFGYRAYPDTGVPMDGEIDVASSMTYTEGFSFGFGLSYARVAYTDLRADAQRATFTLVNYSDRPAVAVPQLYAFKPDSAVLRPSAQLAGWCHLTLQPRERRTVTIPLRLPEVFDSHKGAYVVEGGTYILRLGTSSTETHAECSLAAPGAYLAADEKKLCEYWASESNILQDGYTLEARYKMKKRSPKHICLALILLGLAVVIRFFSFDQGENSLFASLAAGALLLCAVACCVFELVDRSREKGRLIREIDSLNNHFFETAEAASLSNAATLFSKETATEAPMRGQEDRSAKETDEDEDMHTIDKTFTLTDVTADLVTHARTCGYNLTEDDAREVLAAMSSSHMLMTQHMPVGQVSALQEILCSYFGTVVDSVAVDETATEETDLLLIHTGRDILPSPLLLAIERARSKPDMPVVFLLTGVRPEGIPACIAPFVRFAGSPLTCNTIHAPIPGHGEFHLKLPPNFWLLIQPCPGYSKRMASYVTEVTTAISCRVEPYKATAAEVSRRLTYWQFKYLYEKARDEMSLREDRWKQIDRLVAAVGGQDGLSNRTVTGIEQYAATFCACGGEEEIALDKAMVARLVLPLVGVFERSHAAEDVLPSGLIDSVFGEDTFPGFYQMAKWIERGEEMASEETAPAEAEALSEETPEEPTEETPMEDSAEDHPEDAPETDAAPEDVQTETQV